MISEFITYAVLTAFWFVFFVVACVAIKREEKRVREEIANELNQREGK